MKRQLARFERALILLLMANASIVAVGIAIGKSMWCWIVAYWVLLAVKNAVGYVKHNYR